MANTIQLKRFATAGETPDDRGVVLQYGELAVNTADQKLWVGSELAANVLINSIYNQIEQPPQIEGALWYDIGEEKLKMWDEAHTTWIDVGGGTEMVQLSDVTQLSAPVDPTHQTGRIDRIADAYDTINVPSDTPGNLQHGHSYWNATEYLTFSTYAEAGAPDDEAWLKLLHLQDDGQGQWALFSIYVDGVLYSSDLRIWQSLYTPFNDQNVVTVQSKVTYAFGTNNSQKQTHNLPLFVGGELLSMQWGEQSSASWSDGDILVHNATSGMWEPKQGVITATTPATDGQVLSWDAATSKWEPQTPTSGGGALAADDLTDVDTTTVAPVADDHMVWDGTNWVPVTQTPAAISNLTDVSLGASVSGYAGNLVYDAGGSPNNPGEYYIFSDYIFLYNNDQVTDMSQYQLGDVLTLHWSDQSSTGPFTVAVENTQNDSYTHYVSFGPGAGANQGVVSGPLVITSVPERFAGISTNDVLTYDGANWINATPAAGGGGGGGQVDSIVAGTNVTVDNTDPVNPVVSASGGGGGGATVIDDLTDVDTTTAGHIPTNDQVLTWDAGMTHWMPKTPAAGGGGGGVVEGTHFKMLPDPAAADNTVLGDGAYFGNSTTDDGTQNIAIGTRAMRDSEYVYECIAIGVDALKLGEGVGAVIAIGHWSLASDVWGWDNTAIGHYSQENSADGGGNTSVGEYSLNEHTSSYNNTAMGDGAASKIQSDYNTYLGMFRGHSGVGVDDYTAVDQQIILSDGTRKIGLRIDGPTGEVHGTSFVGDGSQLTGVGGGGGGANIDESTRTAPDPWLTVDGSLGGGTDQFFFESYAYAGKTHNWIGDNSTGYQFAIAGDNNRFLIEKGLNGTRLLGYQYVTGGDEGLELVGKSNQAANSTVRLITNDKTSIKVTDGSVEFPLIPTVDPANTGEIWSDGGTLVMSGSTAGASAPSAVTTTAFEALEKRICDLEKKLSDAGLS